MAEKIRTARGRQRATERMGEDPPEVVIAAAEGRTAKIPIGPALRSAALHWSWVVRNRDRWAAMSKSQRDQRLASRKQLAELGVDGDTIEELGGSRLIQVSLPYCADEGGREALGFPWEYVLSSASQLRQFGRRPWIVRRLVVPGRELPPEAPVERAVIVVSAPGNLDSAYSFESEQLLVRSNLPAGVVGPTIENPSPEGLADRLGKLKPGLVHLAGVDNHQGAALLHLDDGGDGYVMTDARGLPAPTDVATVGRAIRAAGSPRLVSCNFWDSARLAAALVAGGAEAAIGFQDQVDDGVAEFFFATFYRTWAGTWRTADAFTRALEQIKSAGASLTGTGVVLWTSRDLFATPRAAAPDLEAGTAILPAGADVVASIVGPPLAPAAGVTPVLGAEALSVEVKPFESLNYALLHNGLPMFERFLIRNPTQQTIRGVEVEAELCLGTGLYRYRTMLSVPPPGKDLSKDVNLPLTSPVLREFRETVQSSVYVSVQAGGEAVFRNTFPVRLVPVEEWREDVEGESGKWLPSFVLPRDPVVAEVVAAANNALRVVRDDGKRAFDGYQSVNRAWHDPYRLVDAQVKALWSTLAYQYGLGYVNPPPTYSSQAQRLRTPSQVLRTKCGTCIDLALLFAACLEYVDIYPVIFLLEDHALPGYWRGEDRFDDFWRVAPVEPRPAGAVAGAPAGSEAPAGAEAPAPGGTAPGQVTSMGAASAIGPERGAPWLFATADHNGPTFREIQARLKRGDLVPIETVNLTQATAFEPSREAALAAVDEGLLAMVDVTLARKSRVTPLPLGPIDF